VTLFPIANAEKYIRTFAPSLVRTGDTLTWASEDGISELSVTPLNQRTYDGLIVSEVVTLTHTSPAFANLSSEWVSRFNSLATISALLPGDESRPTQFVSKVGVFSTDQTAAEQMYAPPLCTEAAVIGWHAARLIRGQDQSDPEQSPLQQTNQAPPFDNADFEAIKAITDRNGYLGSLGEMSRPMLK